MSHVLLLVALAATAVRAQDLRAKMPSPVFVIGVMKGGTTAVFKGLISSNVCTRPAMYAGEGRYHTKEPNFFNSATYTQQLFDLYEARIHANATGSAFAIDASAEYILSQQARDRIAAAYPNSDLRFVVVLRDPVQRAKSHWAMLEKIAARDSPAANWARDLIHGESFAERVQSIIAAYNSCAAQHRITESKDAFKFCSVTASFLHVGFYDSLIERWAERFPIDPHMCIVSSEYLEHHGAFVLELIAKFLGISSHGADDDRHDWELASTLMGHPHASSYPASPVDSDLRAFYQRFGSSYLDKAAEHGWVGCQEHARGE